MKMFSMFSGIGGFEYGFEKVYGKAFKCIGYSEIDKYAIQVYEYHFPGVRNFGNARDIIPEELPDFDILTGGFPCQSFSIAGKRGGFEDTRGTLFFEISRIVSIKRPKLLLLENVKGLLSHDRGRTFGHILATLSDLGYVCEWQVLNSKNFGVPQNRERVFIVGHLGEVGRETVFPLQQDDGLSDAPGASDGGRSQTKHSGALRNTGNMKTDSTFVSITGSCAKMQADMNYVRELKQVGNVDKKGHNSIWGRVYDPKGIATNLNSGGGGMSAKTGLYRVAQRGRGERNEQKIEARKDGITNTLTGVQKDNMINQDAQIRRLTPVECERLQGYPDNWTSEGTQGKISDSQRYKMCGNSVTTNVITAIAKRFRPITKGGVNERQGEGRVFR